jgi:hypothetical protein
VIFPAPVRIIKKQRILLPQLLNQMHNKKMKFALLLLLALTILTSSCSTAITKNYNYGNSAGESKKTGGAKSMVNYSFQNPDTKRL